MKGKRKRELFIKLTFGDTLEVSLGEIHNIDCPNKWKGIGEITFTEDTGLGLYIVDTFIKSACGIYKIPFGTLSKIEVETAKSDCDVDDWKTIWKRKKLFSYEDYYTAAKKLRALDALKNNRKVAELLL